MKTSHPQLALACALIAVALLFCACNREAPRDVLRIGVTRNLTHIAVGQTAHLTAYEEYRERINNDVETVSAAPAHDLLRAPVEARWSVSDPSLASVSEDGTLTALNPGRVMLKGVWNGLETSTTVEVVEQLPVGRLPDLAVRGEKCAPQGIDLRLDADRTLIFRLSFDDQRCHDVTVEANAPAAPLPWNFSFNGGSLQLTSARGLVVDGMVRVRDGSEVSFKVWSDGTGAYPVALENRTVLLIGDSMAAGLAPFLKKRVEAEGGRFLAEPEQSSTIIWWQGSGRLRKLLAEHQPDIVFIALGSNELFMRQPELRSPVIKRMVEEMDGRPAYWIGPLSWKPGAGLLRVIEENFQSGHFYNSDDLKAPRGTDGKHPTPQGYEQWTEFVWNWYSRAG